MKENKKTIFQYSIELFVTGLGSGHSPILSGTCGTFAAAALFYLFLLAFPSIGSPLFIASLAFALFVLGTIASNAALKYKLFGESEDPGKIVIDEFVGFYVSIITLPLGSPSEALVSLCIAFVWFRIFDILKPPPVSTAEKCQGGLGIMLDDVVAGIMALGTSHATIHLYSALA